jgi:hypothetical protein
MKLSYDELLSYLNNIVSINLKFFRGRFQVLSGVRVGRFLGNVLRGKEPL